MRELRVEDEIIAKWKGDLDKPVVSICCVTYNHETYIEDALEGFLSQETDFPFEIIIHDDCSTDKTTQILNEYLEKYPNIIKLIIQTENQWSKGIRILPVLVVPEARGKYIALCDGDDYWIDFEKLQSQVTLMQDHPDINISYHSVYKHSWFENRISCALSKDERVNIVPAEKVIMGGGAFMPTPTIMVKTSVLKNLPRWFYEHCPVGDYYIQVISSIKNGALFMPKAMACYRVNVPGSWTVSQANKKRDIWLHKTYQALNEMNRYYNEEYKAPISKIFTVFLITEMKNESYSVFEKMNMLDRYFNFTMKPDKFNVILYTLIPSSIIKIFRKCKSKFESHKKVM